MHLSSLGTADLSPTDTPTATLAVATTTSTATVSPSGPLTPRPSSTSSTTTQCQSYSTPSPLSSSSATMPPTMPPSSTDMFASLIGREIAASYQRQLLAGLTTPPHLATSPLENPALSTPTIGTPPLSLNNNKSDGTPLPTTAFLPNGNQSPAENLSRAFRKNSATPGSVDQATDLSSSTSRLSTPSNLATNSEVPYILDTAHVATKIREILSSNNIGQRLFAKHVLGLSQGTVSELLSKPKHWEKLTEKGRESYRKMHAWACDENNVNTLKAIAPKKGRKSNVLSSHLKIFNKNTKCNHVFIMC